MKQTFLTIVFFSVSSLCTLPDALAQRGPIYVAPQDTGRVRKTFDANLNEYTRSRSRKPADTRMLGAALNAARILLDTADYPADRGVLITDLFSPADLQYVSGKGISNVVSLFEEVNKQLPEGRKIDFLTEESELQESADNPMVLTDLRMRIAERPAVIDANREQWKENVYLAYMARDYGTKLENTITITSATREMRERPDLKLLTAEGIPVSLAQLIQVQQQKGLTAAKAEQMAVAEFRMLSFPNEKISRTFANENYRRALFALIDLQEQDFRKHVATQNLLTRMKDDLSRSLASVILTAIKNSNFYDINVPGNLGPVLVTEESLADPGLIAEKAEAKSLELLSLTALHYGERDAVKLFNSLLEGKGRTPADATGDFPEKRLQQLKYHGIEKLKSLGFGMNRTEDMRMADLVLVAVAAPELPQDTNTDAYLKLLKVGESVMASYSSTVINETRNTILLGPRVSVGYRPMKYKAELDPVDFATNSPVSQSGLEFRLESDVYFTNPAKIYAKGLKPFLYPEFGVIFGFGKRKVGYHEGDDIGPHGRVPKFKQNYNNWGGHLGLNVGPVLIGLDATVYSTPDAADPYQRFFDLSHSMTYYRYNFLLRAVNLQLGNGDQKTPYHLSLDLEVAGETNNEGTLNRTRTQDEGLQTGGKEWHRAYQRARPNGVYNQAIATEMILNGDVKASYGSANYAAAHFGIQREAFQLKLTAGLYNLHAIDGYKDSKGEWIRNLWTNTFGGYGFAAASLTYNLGWKGSKESRRKFSRSSMTNGVATDPQVTESSSTERISGGLRNRALIMNKR